MSEARNSDDGAHDSDFVMGDWIAENRKLLRMAAAPLSSYSPAHPFTTWPRVVEREMWVRRAREMWVRWS